MSKRQGDGRPRTGPRARVHIRLAPVELKPQVYLDERPAELFDRYHEWARTRQPDGVQDLVRLVMPPLSMLLHRVSASDCRRGWRRLRFPRVQVAYAQPLRYAPIAGCSREQQQAVADEVLAQVRAPYDTLSASAAAVSGPQPALRDPATR